MMILSILATVVLLGALFYHRVSLFIKQSDFARPDSRPRRCWSVVGVGTQCLWPLSSCHLTAPMRKSMISAPVFRGFRKVMPPMSRTEKEAIDAGTTVGGRLVPGKPDWKSCITIRSRA